MDYIKQNKLAWEEAFEHRKQNWGEDNYKRLLIEDLPFFNDKLADELRAHDYRGKTVAQFCCNNGRELLSLMKLGAEKGIGFDIAENIISQAIETACKANISNCDFVACNILDIPNIYYDTIDFAIITAGALTWFKELEPLFNKIANCLKSGGKLLINEFHPVMNMLLMPGEEGFDPEHLNHFGYSYFKKEPWIENDGMSYMSKSYSSKTFTSFAHPLSEIINSICRSGLTLKKFDEFDYDIGLSELYDRHGLPLSYLLLAEKI